MINRSLLFLEQWTCKYLIFTSNVLMLDTILGTPVSVARCSSKAPQITAKCLSMSDESGIGRTMMHYGKKTSSRLIRSMLTLSQTTNAPSGQVPLGSSEMMHSDTLRQLFIFGWRSISRCLLGFRIPQIFIQLGV